MCIMTLFDRPLHPFFDEKWFACTKIDFSKRFRENRFTHIAPFGGASSGMLPFPTDDHFEYDFDPKRVRTFLGIPFPTINYCVLTHPQNSPQIFVDDTSSELERRVASDLSEGIKVGDNRMGP